MKAQILSRIQSYQSIRIKSNSTRKEHEPSFTYIKRPYKIFSKYPNNNKKESQHLSTVPVKKPTHSQINLDNFRKSLNKTRFQEIKQSLNTEKDQPSTEQAQKLNFPSVKKNTHKINPSEQINSFYFRDMENQPNRNNLEQLSSQRSLSQLKRIKSSKDFHETKITSKKDFMKIFSRKNFYRDIACTTSHKNIEVDQIKPEQSYENLFSDKKQRIRKLAKTTGILAREKISQPYINVQQKSKQNSNQKQSIQNLEDHSNQLKNEKEDVSIELSSGGTEEKLDSIREEQELQCSCSRIEEQKIVNDSSFLEASQKEMLMLIERKEKKKNSKHWRRLPNDFLKP